MTLKTTITTDEDLLKIMRPMKDRLIIIRDENPKETESGIDISLKREKANTGTVIKLGLRCDIGKPTRIMFGRGAGTPVTINERLLLILREQDCFLDLETMQTFHDKVLLRPAPIPQEIKGIFIPESANEQPRAGTVLSVGPRCEETVVGDRVLFGKFAGMFVTPEKEELLIIREDDLIADL